MQKECQGVSKWKTRKFGSRACPSEESDYGYHYAQVLIKAVRSRREDVTVNNLFGVPRFMHASTGQLPRISSATVSISCVDQGKDSSIQADGKTMPLYTTVQII